MNSPGLLQSRAGRRGHARPIGLPQRQAIPSLRLWRKRNITQAARDGIEELRAALLLTMWPGRSDWPAAARGDATTAIHLAFAVLTTASPSPWTIDLAGSALLLCQIDGNLAAGLVLSRLRRRFPAPNDSSEYEEA